MRRRALIMAVLLVAPLALLGGSRRPVFLLRPSPGLRKRVRFSAPNPPPRVQGGGYFLACRAGVAFSLRPFLVSAPSLRPARLGLAAAAPAARSPSAGALVRCGRSSLVHRGFFCLRHQSGSVPTAKRANRGHIAARFPPCCLRDTSLVGCVRRCQPTATARVFEQGKTLAALPPVQIDVQAPSRQSRNVFRPVSTHRVPIFRLPRT